MSCLRIDLTIELYITFTLNKSKSIKLYFWRSPVELHVIHSFIASVCRASSFDFFLFSKIVLNRFIFTKGLVNGPRQEHLTRDTATKTKLSSWFVFLELITSEVSNHYQSTNQWNSQTSPIRHNLLFETFTVIVVMIIVIRKPSS